MLSPQSWICDLTGTELDESLIWKRVNELSTAESEGAGCTVTTAHVRPFGERHDPKSVFALESLSLGADGHLPLGTVFR